MYSRPKPIRNSYPIHLPEIKAMNEAYATSILKSVKNVFSVMAQIETAPQPEEHKPDAVSCGEVSGIIEITGHNFQGSIAISFSKELIIELTKRMLHMEIVEIDATAQDLAKEMSNMLIGGAKSDMDDEGYHADMSVPSLVMGSGHKIVHTLKAPTKLIPVKTTHGSLWIELCFSQRN